MTTSRGDSLEEKNQVPLAVPELVQSFLAAKPMRAKGISRIAFPARVAKLADAHV